MKADFTSKLLKWNREKNNREMPWKGEKDPYRIWLSEIILQQTRVEQGLAYYQRFIAAFPTIGHLAKAPREKVFKLWEGLGYYSRCKNLLETAGVLHNKYGDVFPADYDRILSLKGVGPYTAAAIASFAFGLPHAVLDGNVFRVLSRYFGIDTPIDSGAGKKLYAHLANSLLDQADPGTYNQAIMDFGAVICKPRLPLCNSCPQKRDCRALALGVVNRLPVKEKQLARKNRWLYYVVVQVNDQVLIRQRSAGDIWESLFEFVLYESETPVQTDKENIRDILQSVLGTEKFQVNLLSPVYKQQLTHQQIAGQFIEVTMHKVPAALKSYELVKRTELTRYAFPKFINQWLQSKSKPMQLF